MDRSGSELDRRTFVQRMSKAATVLLAHSALPRVLANEARTGPARPDEPRILRLRLLTAAPLPAMRRFYHERIGFSVIDESADEITFAAGATPLTFVRARPEEIRGTGGRGRGEPFYHFAFNIPQNKIRAARDWQIERSELVPTPESLRDPAYPNDVRHFRHWNAHSVFFFDPAFNIVEYIARHDLKIDGPDPSRFSTADILYASEIGFVFEPSQHVAATRMLHETLRLGPYPPDSDPWWAMGDERGLLLCLARKGDLWGENTPTPVRWDVYPTDVTVAAAEPGVHAFDGFPYRVRVA